MLFKIQFSTVLTPSLPPSTTAKTNQYVTTIDVVKQINKLPRNHRIPTCRVHQCPTHHAGHVSSPNSASQSRVPQFPCPTLQLYSYKASPTPSLFHRSDSIQYLFCEAKNQNSLKVFSSSFIYIFIYSSSPFQISLLDLQEKNSKISCNKIFISIVFGKSTLK